MRFLKKAKRGFTLVELVVVIAVIAILAAVSVGAYFGVTESANNSRLEQETKALQTALKTISLGSHENQSLSIDGLRVTNIDKFESDLEEATGGEYEVLTSDPLLLSRQTIVLKTAAYERASGGTILYQSFEYYNPDISGKKVVASTINDDLGIEKIGVIPVDKTAQDVTNNLVYVANEAGWSEVYVYAWMSSNTEVKNHSWPGLKMESLGGNLYAFYLTSNFDKVIFNNGSGVQSDNLEVPIGVETNCYNNSTKAWGELPEGEIVTPEVQYKEVYYASYWDNPSIHAWSSDYATNGYYDKEMTLVSGNLYKVDIPVSFDAGMIVKNSTGKLQTSDILFTGYDAEQNKVLWNGSEWTVKENVPTYDIKTMYAILSDEYTSPKIHTWGNDNNFKTIWEGVAMTKVENAEHNIWSYNFVDIPTGAKIHQDENRNTDDITFNWSVETPYYYDAQKSWISATDIPSQPEISVDPVQPEHSHVYIEGTCECGKTDPNYVAPEPEAKLYLKPNDNWKTDNARFAAYFMLGENVEWVDMTDSDGDSIYEVVTPNTYDYDAVIFCRMNPSTTENNWDNKWNQTDDLSLVYFTEHPVYHVMAWDKCGFFGEKEDSFVAEENTIYFVNIDNYNAPYIWAWDNEKNYTGGSWPGKPMQQVEGCAKLYKYTFNEQDFAMVTKVLFSDNGSNSAKTGDLEFSISKVFYYNSGFHSSI